MKGFQKTKAGGSNPPRRGGECPSSPDAGVKPWDSEGEASWSPEAARESRRLKEGLGSVGRGRKSAGLERRQPLTLYPSFPLPKGRSSTSLLLGHAGYALLCD
jgi:hypothetical protein